MVVEQRQNEETQKVMNDPYWNHQHLVTVIVVANDGRRTYEARQLAR
jgi:hypothetical protein